MRRYSTALLVLLIMALALPVFSVQQVRAATVTADLFTDPAASGCATTGTQPCSLRDAVTFANAHPGTTIQLLAGTYALTATLTLTANMTLSGAGASSTVIDGGGATPYTTVVMDIQSGATVSIGGATIQHGFGGLRVGGALTLTDSIVTHNCRGDGTGTGMLLDGSGLTLVNTTVSDNLMSGCVVSTQAPQSGAGIWIASGSISISGSTISNNLESVPAGCCMPVPPSAQIYVKSGTLTVTNSTVTCTVCTGSNVGLAAGSGTMATVDHCLFSHNSIASQGALGVSDSTITGSTTVGTGGIAHLGTTLTVVRTMVSGNQASSQGHIDGTGGGIYAYGTGAATITDSVISENSAAVGGGIFSGTALTISRTTISGNTATVGGGIVGTATIIDSTVTGNTAVADASGVSGFSAITNSTISGNHGGAGALVGNPHSSHVPLVHVTLANNGVGIVSGSVKAQNSILADSCAVAVASDDYNIDGGTGCHLYAAHDLVNTDPKLAPLTSSGATQYHDLQPTSPALDQIPATGAGCTATDQRGVTRPQGTACDIGAVEHALPVSIAVAPASAALKVGGTQAFTATGTYPGGVTADLTNQVTWTSDSPVASVDAHGTATGLSAGTAHISATQGNVSGQATVTVSAPTPVGIQPAPATGSRPGVTTGRGNMPAPAPPPRAGGAGASTSGTASSPTPAPVPTQR